MAPTLEGSAGALWPDFPRGPLSRYRARASFSGAQLLLLLEGEDLVRFKVRRGAAACAGSVLVPRWKRAAALHLMASWAAASVRG